MKRVGEILREERLKQGKTLDEVSQVTKVKFEYLGAIEEGDYTQLPSHIYTQGFVRSYAEALGLDSGKILPFYRRERKDLESKPKTKILQPIREKGFKITPDRLFTVLISGAVLAFLIFLFFQYRTFAGIPVLIVDSPDKDFVTEEVSVEVAGTVDQDAEVTVNGEVVNKQVGGLFSLTYRLNDGLNRIRIVATNSLGKKNIVERVVEKRVIITPTPVPSNTPAASPSPSPTSKP